MAKVVKFTDFTPQKFGLQRVRKRRGVDLEKFGQLNLFSGARIVKLNQLSTFEEALLHDDNHNLTSAKDLYLKAVAEGDSLADAYCNLGILESEEGNRSKAIDYFTRSLKADPRHHEAHYNLANLYADAGELNLAKFHYGIAIEIEPMFLNCYFNLGLTLALNKEYQEAIKIFTKYRTLSPTADQPTLDALIEQLSAVS
jgi:tetratricopeptide (TPR) repeat protein